MKFLDALLGRSKPKKPDLDQLFGVPQAALTLEAAASITPTGVGSVCYRAAEGGAFATTQSDIEELLQSSQGGPTVERTEDAYGYTWLVNRHESTDVGGLVTDLHAINSSLEVAGFGPSLLCSLVYFRGADDRSVALVYLYKRGSFYPFAPSGGKQRDNVLELQVRNLVADDLRLEEDTSRWFPVWGAPGL